MAERIFEDRQSDYKTKTVSYVIGAGETTTLSQRLKVFFDSLNEEKESLRLSLPELLQYKLLVIEEQQGRIIGIAGLLGKSSLFLVVKSDYQNLGIGQKLTKKVIQKVIKKGYDYITLNVLKSNRKAVHIYRKLGFRKVYSSIRDGRDNYFMMLPINLLGWFFFSLVLWRYKIKSLLKKFRLKLIQDLWRLGRLGGRLNG